MYEIKYRNEDEMKDSGIEWVEKVPNEWSVLNIGNIGRLSTSSVNKKIDKNEKEVNLLNYLDVYNSKRKMISNDIEFMRVTAKQGQLKSAQIEKGDVYFTPSSETIEDIGHSAVVIEDIKNTLFSYHIVRLTFSRRINIGFKKYMFNNYFVLNQFSKKASGTTRKTLNMNDFKYTNILLPSKEEQQKIANFLDLKTAEFDSIISKKELLIEKLEEAKKSLISEVVTGKVKIVNWELVERKPDEMKDSGIEWLGMIPKDWKVKRLKYLTKINPIKSEVKKNNIKCSFVPMDKIGKGEIILDEEKSVSEVYVGYTYFRNKDIVMAKVTPCFENGNIAIADKLTNGIAFGTTEINVFRAINVDLNFLYYTFQESHFMNYAVKHMTGVAGLKRIPTTYFENYYVALPNQTEQKLISEYIINLVGNIYKIENKTKLQIQKLKQAKQSLISEAVTGKIDLRDWEIQES